MALPRLSDPILSLLVAPPASVPRVRAIARLTPDDAFGLVQRPRKNTGE